MIARDYKLKPLQPPIEYCDAPHDGPYKTPISQERKSVPPKSSRGSPQRRIRSIESIQEPQSNDVDYLHSPGRQPQQISGDLITMNDYPPAYPYQPPQESPYSSAFAYNQQHTIESLSMVAPCAFPLGAPITHMVDPPDLCRNLSDSNKSVHDNPFCLSQRYSSRPDRGYELSYEPFNGVNSASQTRQQRVTVDPISFSSDLSVPDQFDEGNLYGVN